jgi:hypothetical protein
MAGERGAERWERESERATGEGRREWERNDGPAVARNLLAAEIPERQDESYGACAIVRLVA